MKFKIVNRGKHLWFFNCGGFILKGNYNGYMLTRALSHSSNTRYEVSFAKIWDVEYSKF